MKKQKTKKRRWPKRLLLLSLLLFTLIPALAFLGFGIIYYTTDYSADEQLFEMAKGNRSTRFYYNAASLMGQTPQKKTRSLSERLEDLSLFPDQSGSNVMEVFEGYIAAELKEESPRTAENGIWCRYDTIPEDLKNAFVAIEDKRFFSHAGVDWLRTAKAVGNYFLHFDSRFGGSTITQQLIKNISSDDEVSATRKIREICRALHLETHHSKEEILELYLNIVPLSQGCVGVGAAARRYYDKEVSELTLSEAAALAAITNAPAYYDPIGHPENNKARRDLILSEMFAQGMIDEDGYRKSLSENLTLRSATDEKQQIYGWYTETVLSDVIRDLEEKKGYSHETAVKLAYRGGLSVYTLMDPTVQSVLEEHFADLKNLPSSCQNGLEMAMAVIDPYTGDLLGIVGGVGEKRENRILNYATDALRAPGSVIKPLSVYAPALEEGIINYASVFDDVPVTFRSTARTQVGWPQNYPAVYSGLTDLPRAIAFSKNTVAVRVLEKLGVERSYSYLTDRLGIDTIVRSRITENGSVSDLAAAPLALGQLTDGVNLRDLTAAYTALADGGRFHEARSYALVLDHRGEVLLVNQQESRRAFRATTASLMTELLRGVVEEGTASAIQLDELVDLAGKTGTSGEGHDKWFVGYSPYFVSGIWCGYPAGDKSVPNDRITHLKVWEDVMRRLHLMRLEQDESVRGFTLADGLVRTVYCRDSGEIPGEACRHDARGTRTAVGLFERGSEPHTLCSCHTLFAYDQEGGGVAHSGCPASSVEYIGLIQVKNRDFPIEVYVEDAQYTCRPYIAVTDEGLSPLLPYFSGMLSKGHFAGVSYTADGRQYNAYCQKHRMHAEDEEGEPLPEEDETDPDPMIPWYSRFFSKKNRIENTKNA